MLDFYSCAKTRRREFWLLGSSETIQSRHTTHYPLPTTFYVLPATCYYLLPTPTPSYYYYDYNYDCNHYYYYFLSCRRPEDAERAMVRKVTNTDIFPGWWPCVAAAKMPTNDVNTLLQCRDKGTDLGKRRASSQVGGFTSTVLVKGSMR